MAGTERNIYHFGDMDTPWGPVIRHDAETIRVVTRSSVVDAAGHLTIAEATMGRDFVTQSIVVGEPSMDNYPVPSGDTSSPVEAPQPRGKFNVCDEVPVTTPATPYTGPYNYSEVRL